MNKWEGMGRATRDFTVSYSGDLAIASGTLAIDRRGKKEEGKQTADFIPIKAFGKTAQFLEKYGLKGTKFAIVGHIQTGSYENKEGNKVYTFDVVAEEIEFAESKASSSSGQSDSKTLDIKTDDGGFLKVEEEEETDLPFGRI